MGKFFERLQKLIDDVEFKITGKKPYHFLGPRMYSPAITREYFEFAKRNPVFAKYLDRVGDMNYRELSELEQKVMPASLIRRLEHVFDQDKRYSWYAVDCVRWCRGGMG
jgi:hypothetical protein